jgi:hypothetical protein
MTCVTAGAHGFVAGGSSADVGVPLWTSPDGSTWTRIGSWAAFLGETGILSVAETADGYIVHGTLDGRTTAWTSTDGLTWHRVDLALDGMLLAVIHGSRGFLAVGTRAEGGQAMFGADASGVAWTSDDGLHWLRAEVPALAASVVAGAAEGPGGYVAVGLRRSAASMESAMWTSRDGLAWSAVAGVDVRSAGLFTNAASDGRHLVVAMETGISVTQLRPTVWISDGIVR